MASNDQAEEPNASELIQVLKVLKKYNLKVSPLFSFSLQLVFDHLVTDTCNDRQDSEEILKRELNKKTPANLIELIAQGSSFK